MAQLPHRPSSRVEQSGRVGVLGLLTIVILLGAGCSGPDESAEAGGSATHAATHSTTGSASADSGATSLARTPATSGQPPESRADSTSHPPATGHATGTVPPTVQPSLPGGSAGREQLTERGWIDDDGALLLNVVIADIGPATGGGGVTTAADTATNVGSLATAKSLCAFLFGTSDQVGRITLLPDEPRLDPTSGYQPGATGNTIACVYDIDSDPALVLQITHGPPIDPNLPGNPIVVTAGAVQAALSYAPGYTGDTITGSLARDWLTAVAGRTGVVGGTAGGTAGG